MTKYNIFRPLSRLSQSLYTIARYERGEDISGPQHIYPATNWQVIDFQTKRTPVFGGWLVKVTEEVAHLNEDHKFGHDWRVALAFVPDPNHEWKLTEGERV